MLQVKPKVRLSRARDNDYSSKLGCDCVVYIVYLSRSNLRSQEKREKKRVGQNTNHQDLVFGKVLHDALQNWQ